MINLEKIKHEKCKPPPPPLLRRPTPEPYFHHFLKFFRVFPSGEGN